MDVIIPSHNLKILSSAVSTLGKIGKVLYIEFDPFDGLTLRALNDAKSSFCCFHFDVGFFERCTTSSAATTSTTNNISSRSVAARNANLASRTRNNLTHGGVGNSNSASSRRRRKRGRASANTPMTSTRNKETKNDEDNEFLTNNDDKYVSKVPIKTIAAVLRSRKGVSSLRIQSTTSIPAPTTTTNDNGDDIQQENEVLGAQMQLSFEYSIQTNGIMRVVHKINVSTAEGIIAIANKDNCSEIVTLPKILLTMLDQVKSTTEVALTVHNDECKKVVTSSFHYGDTTNSNNNGNMVLNASNAAILKTETSIDCHEFEEFHFMDDFAVQSVLEKEQEANNHRNETTFTPPPTNVSDQVTLVFSIKEAKAMLQFCVSSQSSYLDGEDPRVIVNFYWGGRPLIIETEGESFHGELILATVDHVLLNGS